MPSVSFQQTYSLTSNTTNNMEANSLTYEYVRESDINVNDGSINGYTLYKYSFDNDWVLDPSVQISMPWKRGKLLEKTVYKTGQSEFLTKEINTYAVDQTKVSNIVGFKRILRKVLNLNSDNYAFYATTNCGIPENFFQANTIHKYNVAIPWEYLKSTEIIQNFFDQSNQLIGAVTTNKTYNYNNSNHLQISSELTTNSLGEALETKYYYPGDNEVASEPYINELFSRNILTPIKSQLFRAGNKLSERKTVYKNWGDNTNPLFLPELIQGSKGQLSLENRVRFVKVDTANGNVLQLRQENGTNVSYIWGYNGTLPVAKIENAEYSSISTALITDAQTASLDSNEENLKIKLKAIRDALPNAMVTTYTYKPLVGVSSITDPKGDTITYEYDSFGRLKSVKDNFGKLLSENEYNYRPQ